MSQPKDQIKAGTLRPRFEANRGRREWRSLEGLIEEEEGSEVIKRDFPRQAAQLENALDRRSFLKLMGASLALAGLTACGFRPPDEKIVPYDRQPEEIIPGRPLYYATAMTLQGYATGLLVESHEGRPTKVEGNPDHPASLGATDVFAQASVLTLYDPDRSRTVMREGRISTWEAFLSDVSQEVMRLRGRQGSGLRILTETVTSPTLASQLQSVLKDFPQAVWHQYEPAGRDQQREGARLAFGEYVETIYRFDRAEIVLALESDFLSAGPGSLRYARDFIFRRKVRDGQEARMNRLYAVECAPTSTGAMADHRLPLKASEIESFARAVAARLGVRISGQSADPQSADPQSAEANSQSAAWLDALSRDLLQHRGASIIIAGDEQPPIVHALCHAMNQALGNVGQTVNYLEVVEANPVNQTESLGRLVADMKAGNVETLIIIGGNPAFDAPADFQFAESLSKVNSRVHLSLYEDETSELCDWHIPEAHFLETWSDARAYDGTASIIQPLIAPLYDGKSAHELLAAFSDQPERTGYDIIRDFWRTRATPRGQAETGGGREARGKAEQSPNAMSANGRSANSQSDKALGSPPATSADTADPLDDFERSWRQYLHDGVITDSSSQPKSVSLKTDWMDQAATSTIAQTLTPSPEIEILFRTDPAIFDGRFANNAWLQELPKPLTKLTWDNAALVSPALARRYGLTDEVAGSGGEHGAVSADILELSYQGRTLRVPAFIMPGHADEAVTLYLGYGRKRAGRVGEGLGFNAYALRTSDAPWFGRNLIIRKTGERYALACTQAHHRMEGRDLVRSASLDEYRARPDFARREADDPRKALSLYPEWKYEGYAWGMAIETGSCMGCNACVVACQAENNIPVVGREEVLRAREMHWLRIDRYYTGDESNPETLNQPVPCQHCETAPCEVVCPVEATTHSDEGLNEMTYNRCVGTRYCSNNCPYKVRRFNFFEYADFETPVLKLQRNPSVTVRSRGVMEKCTYCVQRINAGKIEAEKENREVRDLEIVPACQQACPTEAIVFGNINDPDSRVSKLKRERRNYSLLAELNTRPRTTYLATIRNPNQEIDRKPSDDGNRGGKENG